MSRVMTTALALRLPGARSGSACTPLSARTAPMPDASPSLYPSARPAATLTRSFDRFTNRPPPPLPAHRHSCHPSLPLPLPHRSRPLEFWRGERVVYGRAEEGASTGACPFEAIVDVVVVAED